MKKPLIFDIKRSSVDDGPGIRTVVFLKGCLLRCQWCHNPESWNSNAEVAFYREYCIGCGECSKVCLAGALDITAEKWLQRDKCQQCGSCAETCYASALRMVGKPYSVDALVEILLRDRVFYEASGGGVTFSGGEPMLYMDYVGEVLRRLKAEGVHTAVETSGHFDWANFTQKVLPFLDLVLYDVKIFTDEAHRRYTGQSNELILANLRELAKPRGIQVIPRVPLIPGVTDSQENLHAIANYVRECGCSSLLTLPYNPGWELKQKRLE